MRKSLYAGLAGLSFALAAPAWAQDASSQPADTTAADTTSGAGTVQSGEAEYDPVTKETPFSGLYVGGTFGFAAQNNDVGSGISFDRGSNGSFGETVTTGTGANAFSTGFCNGAAVNALSPANGGRCLNDEDGLEYYGRVGFDAQRGKFVVGVVGEFGRPEISDSVTAFSTTPANYVMTRSVDWEASIRGRAGFVAGRSTLFYGAFGPGYLQVDNDFRSTNTANSFSSTNKDKIFGVTGGGGVEQMIGNNFSIGLEYMYHRYIDDDARVRVGAGSAPATNPFRLAGGVDFQRADERFTWHSIRGTVNFRF
jgi:outer membrane immunogenic protein